jgi:hypothetical protein
MTAALDRAVANALGLKSVNNCEKWSKTMKPEALKLVLDALESDYRQRRRRAMIEEDDDIQVYKRPWVGLTDEDIGAAYVAWDDTDGASFADFARAVEQLLKEKNV